MKPDLSDAHASFLRDESRLSGEAESIEFPRTEAEVLAAVQRARERGATLTPQGARTGICGAAVPRGGVILNFSEMRRPLGLERGPDNGFRLRVQPGYLLADLRRDLARRSFDWPDPAAVDPDLQSAFRQTPEQFWPPDPSETTASLGGLASTNGRGPGAWRYGSTGDHLAALRAVLADGEIRQITPDATPELWSALVGGEGLFGAVTELTLRLRPRPEAMWGIAFFFAGEGAAAAFIDQARTLDDPAVAAMDFLDHQSLTLVRELKAVAAKLRELPDAPEGARAAVYLELHADAEEKIENAAGDLMARAEALGSDPDESWALSGNELDKLRLFRHAVPEAVNARIDALRLTFPGLTKTAGDLTLPGIPFAEALARYRADIENQELSAAVFGHARDNHLHVNLLPRDEAEREKARALLAGWLAWSRELGGRLFREHGVGKLKRALCARAEDPAVLAARRALKDRLDPRGLWNPGNLFLD